MVSAIPFVSAAQFPSYSSLPPSSQGFGGCQIPGVARTSRCSSRSVGVARRSKGENDVKLVRENEKETETTETKGMMMMEVAKQEQEEPFLLRIGVALVTELLRVFSSLGRATQPAMVVKDVASPIAVDIQNVVEILRKDYERAYFLTGDFTTSLYDINCLFADPTIQFRGRDKYQRNLKLLVPFFEEPKLTLFDIEEEGLKGQQGGEEEQTINANWNLRTYLKLPWKPLIDVNGSTLYVIDANSKIVKHIESWSISGRQAVQQLFVPSGRASQGRKS